MLDRARIAGLSLGVAAFAAVMVFPAPEGMSLGAWRVLGVAALMAIWWMTQAAPLPVTALIPLGLFPMIGVTDTRSAAAPYADPVIFLFLGGFILGLGMQRSRLQQRLGLRAIGFMGATPARLIGGFMLSTAFLSMWVSNSATSIMMLPVALSVLALAEKSGGIAEGSHENLSVSLLLGVAYGASIGGLATLIGTPPNALLAAYMAREHGVQIGFAQWMLLGVPLAALMLAGAWFILVRLHPVVANERWQAHDAVASELARLGPVSAAEIRVALVFFLTAGAWMTRPLYGSYLPALDDSGIAIIAAIALFLLPSGRVEGGRLLAWEDLRDLPWDVLILFGGGLSLAAAISSSGLAAWLGAEMQVLANWPMLLLVAALTLAMIFLTELTSNTASAATFLPIGGALALGLGLDPLTLAVPLALAASCAFMLPVATPPNAIVFSSGRISITQMALAGLWLNIYGSLAIVAASAWLAGWALG